MATTHVPLLVIGAGPYGLATAACAKAAGIDALVLGEPMGFWRNCMPDRMLLRSGPQWQLDAAKVHTIFAYLEARGIDPADVTPLPVSLFIAYAQWFCETTEIRMSPRMVSELQRSDQGFRDAPRRRRAAHRERGRRRPRHRELREHPDVGCRSAISSALLSHARSQRGSKALRGSRCAIFGGRMSAFEWAALLAEDGAEAVHVVYRHDTPAFATSYWDFVEPLMMQTLENPGWYRGLPAAERDAVANRFWAEGRLKLEPWLTPRLATPTIRLHPHAEVRDCRELPSGVVQIDLTDGERLVVDHVILATGYKAEYRRCHICAACSLALAVTDGSPRARHAFPVERARSLRDGFCGSAGFRTVLRVRAGMHDRRDPHRRRAAIARARRWTGFARTALEKASLTSMGRRQVGKAPAFGAGIRRFESFRPSTHPALHPTRTYIRGI